MFKVSVTRRISIRAWAGCECRASFPRRKNITEVVQIDETGEANCLKESIFTASRPSVKSIGTLCAPFWSQLRTSFSFFLSFKDSLTALYLDLGLCAGLVDLPACATNYPSRLCRLSSFHAISADFI